MYSDNNARRRNLILLSLVIIFYHVSGAHFESGEVRLGLVNAVIERGWMIHVFAFIMLGWFWWQFRIDRDDLKQEFLADLHAGANERIPKRHPFYQTLERELRSAMERDVDRFRPALPDSDLDRIRLEIQSSPSFPLGIWAFRATAHLLNPEGRKDNKPIQVDVTDWRIKFKVIWQFIRHRPAFSEILFPQLLAGIAIVVSSPFIILTAWRASPWVG